MDERRKQILIDILGVMVTGGLYAIYIFVKILFTTPSGQKKVEEKVNSWMKAKKILAEGTDE